ncbi:MAG: hypothetical protein HN948_00115 [Clostridia bacterium]|jgi:predicted permease|nr:hypothetical protein [Clostridia bacterium]MBT7121391.1 hypothetical protein [Clostridia bacterium]
MGKLIFSLAIIVGALVVGQILYGAVKGEKARAKTDAVMTTIRNIIVYSVTPVILLGAFWVVDIGNASLITVPFICIFALGIGSSLSLLFSKIAKHNRLQTGAMFCCGGSSNLGSIGGLLTFAFLGETGYAFCVLYIVLSAPFLYTVVFPVASSFSESHIKTHPLKRILKDKLIMMFFATMLVGFILNLVGVPRPAFYSKLNEYLIPISSFFLVAALGYTMRFGLIRSYPKEIVFISIVKYIITPLFVIGTALLLGLNTYGDGTLFKALVIMSALPVGFNALIPINMYGLDKNLGNSNWIVTTVSLVVVVPVVYIILF